MARPPSQDPLQDSVVCSSRGSGKCPHCTLQGERLHTHPWEACRAILWILKVIQGQTPGEERKSGVRGALSCWQMGRGWQRPLSRGREGFCGDERLTRGMTSGIKWGPESRFSRGLRDGPVDPRHEACGLRWAVQAGGPFALACCPRASRLLSASASHGGARSGPADASVSASWENCEKFKEQPT